MLKFLSFCQVLLCGLSFAVLVAVAEFCWRAQVNITIIITINIITFIVIIIITSPTKLMIIIIQLTGGKGPGKQKGQ